MKAAYAYKWITDTWTWGTPVEIASAVELKNLIIRGLVDCMKRCGEPEMFCVFSTKDDGATLTEEFKHVKYKMETEPKWPTN